MKAIAWNLVGTHLILATVIIICPCLCSHLRAEEAKEVLTPNLAPLLIQQPAVTTSIISHSECPLLATAHISLLAQALISVQRNLPSWEPGALVLACLSLPFA